MSPKAKRKAKLAEVKTLSVELLSTAEAGQPFVAPKEFRLFRAGMNDSHKGVFKFTAASAERVMAKAKEYANEFAIDYAHGMFSFITADPAESGKAAGWFKPEVREGELWATAVSWTKKAAAMLEDREYRYISPAFETDQSGEIHTLLNVALTNIPAIFNLEPLVASAADIAGSPEVDEEEESPDMNPAILILLGLNKDASEADVMAALQRLMSSNRELLQFTGKAAPEDALAVVKAWKVAADSVPAMHQELSQLKERAETEKRDTLIADGKKRGVVPPAYEAVLKTFTLSQLEAFLAVAQPVHTKGKTKEPTTDSTVTVALSQEEANVARLLGVDPKAYAERKAARGSMVPQEVLAGEAK